MLAFAISFAISFAILVAAVEAQIPSSGQCNKNMSLQPSFNLTRYLGGWYEMEKFPNIFEPDLTCETANYTLKADAHVEVRNGGKFQNGTFYTATGDAYVPDATQPAKLAVRFYALSPYAPYWVVATNYNQYTLVYSCTQVTADLKTEFAWILSRTKTLDDSLVTMLHTIAKGQGIPINYFTKTLQNC